MAQVQDALKDVRELYAKLAGAPAPELHPGQYVPFPAGVDPVHHAIEEVDQLKGLTEQVVALPKPVAWIPRADTFATKEAWFVRLEIPGVRREDVEVFVSGPECVVRGERKLPDQKAGLHPVVLERPAGVFERRFGLPSGADFDKLEAHYEDGELELKFAIGEQKLPERKQVDVV
jgi:HSP20 family protein